jgi:hypothetical protein
LDELRARTGVLLAASSVSISFLGREALEGPGRALAVGVAVCAFIVSTAASIYVVLPRRALVSAIGGSRVYDQWDSEDASLDEVHWRLAYDLSAFCDANDRDIDRLVRAFAVSAAALTVELVALVAALARTIA